MVTTQEQINHIGSWIDPTRLRQIRVVPDSNKDVWLQPLPR